MKLLIDTCTFLWFIENSPSLSPTALNLIEDGANEILLSIISVWEIAIKFSIGKLAIIHPIDKFIETQLKTNDIKLLNISLEEVCFVASLPFHHKDPFDRLIISQAVINNLPVISADSVFNSYPIKRFW